MLRLSNILRGPAVGLACLAILTAIGCGAAAPLPSTQAGPSSGATGIPADSRKIIYTANMQVYVDDIGPIPDKIVELAERHQAIIAYSSFRGLNSQYPYGQWEIRVPAENYRSLLQDYSSLGQVVSQEESSQEVTEEYFDLQARLKSKVQEEERLLEHLQADTAELKDILAVETELSRVRMEIEQLQGRQRFLDDQVALSTVHLDVYEFPNFVPDGESATFGTRMSRAWSQSWSAFCSFIANLTIFAVAAIPWLVLLAVPITIVFLIIRKLIKSSGRGPRQTARE